MSKYIIIVYEIMLTMNMQLNELRRQLMMIYNEIFTKLIELSTFFFRIKSIFVLVAFSN